MTLRIWRLVVKAARKAIASRNPQAIEPGTAMPTQGVTADEAAHMAAYLYTLNVPELGPPHPFPLRWLEAIGHVRRTGPND